MTRLAAAVCVLLAALAPSRAGTLSDASYGQLVHEGFGSGTSSGRDRGRGGKSKPETLKVGESDGKVLGFTLSQAQEVRVYGGTTRSAKDLSGDCGMVSSDAPGAAPARMTWTPHQQGEGGGRTVNRGYDCEFFGQLSSGTYAATVAGRYHHGHGPALIFSGQDSGGLQLTGISATGPAEDLRLSFLNRDASTATVSAVPLSGTGTVDVKVYRYNSSPAQPSPQGQGASPKDARPGQKTALVKAESGSADLSAIPLEAGGAYSIIVRGHGGQRGPVELTVTVQ